MKLLLLSVVCLCAFSCAKINAALDIPNKMDKLNDGMGQTNEAIRMQKLLLAQQELLDEKNHQFLSPIPGDMLAPGKTFAEALTTYEALEWVYVNLKKVNQDVYDGTGGADDEMAFNKKKLGHYMAITVVCGFLPDSTVRGIVNNYINVSDRYQQTGFNILALRAKFYNEVMLGGSLNSEIYSTLGHLAKAVEFNNKIDYIASLPYPQLIKFTVLGFTDQEMNEAMSVTFDPSLAQANWNKIKINAENGFVAQGLSGDASADAAEKQRQINEFNRLMSYVNSKIKTAVH
ncbi:MAG: hypothetical protein ACK41T_02665 [Pseudobdellovibrio sp.]